MRPWSSFRASLPGDGHRGPGTHAQEHAFLPGQAPGDGKGVFVIDIDDLVGLVLIKNPGLVRLLHIFQALDLVLHMGFDGNDLNGRIQFFQPFIEPHDGAAGAQGGHDMGDPAFGLVPDLLGRALIMGQGIAGIIELVGQIVFIGKFPGQAVDFLDGAVGPQLSRGQQYLGPQGLENEFALFAGRLGHGANARIAFDGADHGQTDAGIAAGGLDHRLSRGEFAPNFGIMQHGPGYPVFDGTPGIKIFEFDVNRHPGIGVETVQLDQGRIADQFQNIIVAALHGRTPA